MVIESTVSTQIWSWILTSRDKIDYYLSKINIEMIKIDRKRSKEIDNDWKSQNNFFL